MIRYTATTPFSLLENKQAGFLMHKQSMLRPLIGHFLLKIKSHSSSANLGSADRHQALKEIIIKHQKFLSVCVWKVVDSFKWMLYAATKALLRQSEQDIRGYEYFTATLLHESTH